MKQITLNNTHEQLGAKMVDFAGFRMPVHYGSALGEHHTVRNSVGVFDVSHMGEFFLYGAKALALIQRVISNDAAKLVDGKAQYAYLPNETGGIVDDLIVYRVNATTYMLVVNATNIAKDWNWISSHNTFGVTMEDASDNYSLLAIQGPKAVPVLQSLASTNLMAMSPYTFQIGEFANKPNVILSATGYTGSGGFEVYIPNQYAEEIWDAVLEAGKPYNICPVGLTARNTLRLEMGYCLYGSDIDDTTSPLEAQLGWITKFNKNFINASNLRAEKERGISRKLTGLQLMDKGIPRRGYVISNTEGATIGKVTSGTISPTLNKGIAMAYITTKYARPGVEVFVSIRNRKVRAVVKKPPFITL